MAAISHVFTIRRAAQILGRDEATLWHLSDQLEPEDGMLWTEAVELSVNMVGKIERGVTPSFDTVEKIAAVLEIPEAALFSVGPMALPAGERGKLLQRIHVKLSKLQ